MNGHFLLVQVLHFRMLICIKSDYSDNRSVICQFIIKVEGFLSLFNTRDRSYGSVQSGVGQWGMQVLNLEARMFLACLFLVVIAAVLFKKYFLNFTIL